MYVYYTTVDHAPLLLFIYVGMAGLNLSDQRPSFQPLKPPKPSHADPASRPAVPLPLPKPKKTAESRQSCAYEDTEPTKPRMGAKPLHAKVNLNLFYYSVDYYMFGSAYRDLLSFSLALATRAILFRVLIFV